MHDYLERSRSKFDPRSKSHGDLNMSCGICVDALRDKRIETTPFAFPALVIDKKRLVSADDFR